MVWGLGLTVQNSVFWEVPNRWGSRSHSPVARRLRSSSVRVLGGFRSRVQRVAMNSASRARFRRSGSEVSIGPCRLSPKPLLLLLGFVAVPCVQGAGTYDASSPHSTPATPSSPSTASDGAWALAMQDLPACGIPSRPETVRWSLIGLLAHHCSGSSGAAAPRWAGFARFLPVTRRMMFLFLLLFLFSSPFIIDY